MEISSALFIRYFMAAIPASPRMVNLEVLPRALL
jgi:hypothetical protein